MITKDALAAAHREFEKSRRGWSIDEHPLRKRASEIFQKYLTAGDADGFTYKKDIAKLADEAKKHPSLSIKDLLTSPPEFGGAAVPRDFAERIEFIEKLVSPIRRIVGVKQSQNADYSVNLSQGSEAAKWASEIGGRLETGTAALRQRSGNFGSLYAISKSSEWALDDIGSLEEWLTDEATQQFAVTEGAAVVSGDGTNKPKGVLTETPVTTADFASPPRAADVIEYIPSDTALSPASPGLTASALRTLYFAVAAGHRARGTWAMNSSTMLALFELAGLNDRELVFNPNTGRYHLFGAPIEVWEDLPNIGTNNFPVLFGDFAAGYNLVDRGGLSIKRDPLSEPGFIRFYIFRRETGFIVNNNAIKALRTL